MAVAELPRLPIGKIDKRTFASSWPRSDRMMVATGDDEFRFDWLAPLGRAACPMGMNRAEPQDWRTAGAAAVIESHAAAGSVSWAAKGKGRVTDG